MTLSSRLSPAREEWVKSKCRRKKADQRSGGWSRGIKLGQMASSLLRGHIREDLLLKTVLGSSLPTFYFPSQSMPWGKGVALSIHTKTFWGCLLPSCHTSHGLSMDAGRPYFQTLIAMFIAISLLLFPSILQVEELLSLVFSCWVLQAHSHLHRWPPSNTKLRRGVTLGLTSDHFLMLYPGSRSALSTSSVLQPSFLSPRRATPSHLTGPVFNLEYISSQLEHEVRISGTVWSPDLNFRGTKYLQIWMTLVLLWFRSLATSLWWINQHIQPNLSLHLSAKWREWGVLTPDETLALKYL